MKQRLFFESNFRVPRPGPTTLVSCLSLGLAGFLFLGGCNKAPVAPTPDAATTQAAPPPPAAAPPVAATPQATATPPASVAAAPPAAPALAKATPAHVAPAAPKEYSVPAGTPLSVRIGQTISAKNSNVGDSFNGVLAQSVVVHGVSVLRAGAPVSGTVTASKGQGRFKGSGALGISLRRVGNYTVSTSSYEADAKGKGKRTAGFIAGGGGGGALIGGLAGGGKGALIGGLLGAGAGTAGAVFTGNKDVTIPAETVVTFTLTAPITVVQGKRTEE